ncbi:MAG: nusG [Parachlamydiales bacterium]|nr:nusG [Parachlamydiales bacterium]
MQHWYVVQVISSHEKKVKKSLEESIASMGMREYITEVLIPTEHVSEVKKGQQHISEKRIWPGYLLIKMEFTEDSWAFVKNVDGVIDFLGGEKPVPLTDKEINNILLELEERKKGVVQKHKVEVGDRVKITDGVFVNFTGSVIEVNHEKGRLSVMVSIFGRETRVDDLEFWQVEQVSADSAG